MQLLGITGITQFLAQCIIRPPKVAYDVQQLGKQTFCYQNRIYQRLDMEIPMPKKYKPNKPNKQSDDDSIKPPNIIDGGNKKHKQAQQHNHNQRSQDDKIILCTSLYRDKYSLHPRSTVIYLHANSASRISVKNYLQVLIKQFDVVAFDFRGCGNTHNSKFITLGYLEKFDVQRVIQYIDEHYGARKYILWGRSMGAVTAILHTQKFKKACALVLDSPFSDLRKVIKWLIARNASILPSFMVDKVFESVELYAQQRIKQEYNYKFKISKLIPLQAIRRIRVPIYFIGSQKDDIVDVKQVRQLYGSAGVYKKMTILPGYSIRYFSGHNEIRTNFIKREVVQFIKQALELKMPAVQNRKKIFSYTGRNQKWIEPQCKQVQVDMIVYNNSNNNNDDCNNSKEQQWLKQQEQIVLPEFEGRQQLEQSIILGDKPSGGAPKNRIFSRRNSK